MQQIVAAIALCAFVAPLAGQCPCRLLVHVPPEAKVEIDGTVTTSTGALREFRSPPLPVGQEFLYTLHASWKDDGITRNRMQVVRVEAGKVVTVDFRPGSDRASSEVLYAPSPDEVIATMLKAARVGKDDLVYDLGCGDGRILIEAARRHGARGVGIDIDPARVAEARQRVAQEKLGARIEIRHGDALKVDDLARANVVTLYMLWEFNEKIRPILEKQLKPGTRVAAHQFPIPGWQPARVVQAKSAGQPEVYIYEIK